MTTQPRLRPFTAANERPWPVLRFDRVAVPGGAVSFDAHPGEIVHLAGGSTIAQLRVLAVASGHAFGGPGRCEIAGLETMSLGPAQRESLRISQVARALVSDTLDPELPLLANVARMALARGVPAHLALHRASVELDALGLVEGQSLPPTAVGLATQRLAVIARALVCRPRLLVLERPDLGLGPDELTNLRVALLAAASTHGCCVLMTCTQPRLAQAAHQKVQIGPEA